MPNSLGSSCTADVQGMDWKMSLAGFVFLFSPSLTVSTEVRALGVEALGSLSDECSGVVGAVFFSCWQEPGFQQGTCLREAPQPCVGQSSAPAAGTLQGSWNLPLAGPADTIHGELFRAVSGKGKPGEGGMLV